MVIARAIPRSRSGVKNRAVRSADQTIRTITLRDFDGLMVTAENDLNLQTRFAKRLINVVRGDDGTLAVRQGTQLDIDLAATDEPFGNDEAVSLNYTEDSTLIKIEGASYRPVIGQRIVISGVASTAGNVTPTHVNGSRVVVDYDNDGFYIVSGIPSSTTDSINQTISWELLNWYDTDAEILWGGNIHSHEVYATNKGDIIARDEDGNVLNVFSNDIARNAALTLEVEKVINVVNASFVLYFDIDTTAATRPVVGDIIFVEDVAGETGGIPADEINGYHTVTSVEPTDVDADVTPTRVRFHVATTGTSNAATNEAAIKRSIASGWDECDIVTGTVFNDRLSLYNGVNKPVAIQFASNEAPQAQYIFDPATGSNANVPVGKYVVSGQDHVVVAGILGRSDIVSISQTNTDNTWFNDPDSNGVEIDISRVVSRGSPAVTGIAFHRDLLVITTEATTLFYRLNNFVGETQDIHLPLKIDAVQGFGCIAHRAMQSIGDNMLAPDFVGVVNLKETLLKDRFASNRVSEPIAPTLVRAISRLSVAEANRRVWSVHNKRDDSYMLFIPYNDSETWVFNFLRKELRKVQGWSVLRGWNFTAGWLTTTDRVKFADGMKVFIYGTSGDDITADFIGVTGADPVPIDFVWELPWFDFDRRMHTKRTKYIGMDTQGTAEFKAEMFVDNIYLNNLEMDPDDDIEDDLLLVLDPYLSMILKGGSAVGYGGGEQPYGSGRRTSDERLYAWEARCKIAKMRMSGSVVEPLKFVSMSLGYQNGDIRR